MKKTPCFTREHNVHFIWAICTSRINIFCSKVALFPSYLFVSSKNFLHFFANAFYQEKSHFKQKLKVLGQQHKYLFGPYGYMYV